LRERLRREHDGRTFTLSPGLYGISR